MVGKAFLVAATILMPFAGAVGSVVYRSVGNPFDPFDNRRFSALEWRNGDRGDRCEMTRDLLEHHHLVGLTRDEVTALLGKPDEVRGAVRQGDGRGGCCQTWVYGVGEGAAGCCDADADHVIEFRLNGRDVVERVRFARAR